MRRELVSVMMPSLNQGRFINSAIDSVLSQSHSDLELVIQDGGSTDETLDIIAERAHRDDRIRWHSEPDGGPAEALNRARRRCRGTVFGWLNSDDILEPDAVRVAVRALQAEQRLLMVYGQARHIDSSGRSLAPYPTREPAAGLAAFSDGCFICQPSVFFRRSLSVMLGPFDESLRTAFDLDYWLRAFTSFPGRIGFVDQLLASSRLHENCITSTFRGTVAREGIALTHKYIGKASLHWVTTHIEEIVSDDHLAPDQAKSHIDLFLGKIEYAFDRMELEAVRQQVAGILATD